MVKCASKGRMAETLVIDSQAVISTVGYVGWPGLDWGKHSRLKGCYGCSHGYVSGWRINSA